MKVLVLGGSGMLGHKACEVLERRFDVVVTVRSLASLPSRDFFARATVLPGVSAEDYDSVVRAIAAARPDVTVNCIGIVKQLAAGSDPLVSISVNSLFPHRLADACAAAGSRLVQVSTDCVFSGRRGSYTEDDMPDPVDLYGRTKLLGELAYEHTLTVRTSIIGRELHGGHGLVEWFLSQDGRTVRGFRRAIFSGLTTTALAEHLADVIERHRDLHGVWHVASEPISKFELLELLSDAYGVNVEIEPDDEFVCDRSLDDSRFRAATGSVAPPWPSMIDQMASEGTPYAALRASV